MGTVAIAISTDLPMSVAKAVTAALTGSAGLFAETLHSLAGPRLLARWHLLAHLGAAAPAGGDWESPVVLDRIRDLLTAEVQPLDAISGLRLRQLLAELRERVTAAIPRATLVFVTPAVAGERPPEPTPWDPDYWLRRFPDREQA